MSELTLSRKVVGGRHAKHTLSAGLPLVSDRPHWRQALSALLAATGQHPPLLALGLLLAYDRDTTALLMHAQLSPTFLGSAMGSDLQLTCPQPADLQLVTLFPPR
jgi:hypothetical protein